MANYVLEILDGDRAGEVLPVTGQMLRIGRKAGNDIVLADEKTSGVHCEIAPEGDRLVLKDLGSTNGTFLDGKRITEIVLTPGDVVTVGRLRVKFRTEGEEPAETSDEFAIRTLDAGRLQKRGGLVGLIAVLVLLLAGGGGWFWWQGQQAADDGGGGENVRKRREVLAVSGNRLEKALAGCESEQGFELQAAGAGFQTTGQAHTGTGSLVALRESGESDSGDAAGDAGAPVAPQDFALMRLAEPIKVAAGRKLLLAGHCMTRGGAEVTVRGRLTSSDSQLFPFEFAAGAPLAAHDGWQRIEVSLAVPSGCDQLMLEVVALLPGDEAEAYVDDLAVTEDGTVELRELRLEESGQTAIGFGPSLAVRSTRQEDPATLLRVLPAEVPPKMRSLHAAGLCELSDLGATLRCESTERSLQLAVEQVTSLRMVFPADAAGGLLVAAADGKFASTAANGEFAGVRVLLGHADTRAMLRFPESTELSGKTAGGRYRLDVQARELELVLGFRAQRRTADQLLRTAREAVDEGRPGDALDELTRLLQEAPMDSKLLGEALQLRGALLGEQAQQLQALQADLDKAAFFSTRGGFERIVAGVRQLKERYGEHNLEDPSAAKSLRETAQERLGAFDRQRQVSERERLQQLADAFASARKAGLQKVVESYIERHLPAGAGSDGPNEGEPKEGGAGQSGAGQSSSGQGGDDDR